MKHYAYVGCRTTKERNARGLGIKVYDIQESGKWNLIQTQKCRPNPSFLSFDQTGSYLYAIHGDFSEISSFSVNHVSGMITYINTVSTGGINPVHLSIDKTNHWVFVANLQSGTVAVIPRNNDGSLHELKELYTIPGNGEGTVSHPHQVAQSQDGNYLVVSCQGRKQGFGQVDVFRIDSAHGTLTKTDTVRSREIAEPRHFVFHPNYIWSYGVNEKDYSVTYYHFDKQKGRLTPKQIISTLPDTYTGDGWASGIVMYEDGQHLVVSNRKHDSITSFAINPETGMLSFYDCVKTGGGQPRFITFDKNHKTIVAANETTDSISFFTIDEETGKFTESAAPVKTESPVCVIFS